MFCKCYQKEVTQVSSLLLFFVLTPVTSSPRTWSQHRTNTKLTLWGWKTERSGGEQKNVDELASELKAQRNSRSRISPPLSAASFLRCLCNNSKSRFRKLDPWEERVQTNVPQTTVSQTAFCRRTVKKVKLCIQWTPVDELATRDQTFPHSVTPSHR